MPNPIKFNTPIHDNASQLESFLGSYFNYGNTRYNVLFKEKDKLILEKSLEPSVKKQNVLKIALLLTVIVPLLAVVYKLVQYKQWSKYKNVEIIGNEANLSTKKTDQQRKTILAPSTEETAKEPANIPPDDSTQLLSLNKQIIAQAKDLQKKEQEGSLTLAHDGDIKAMTELGSTLLKKNDPEGISWYQKAIELGDDQNAEKVFVYLHNAFTRNINFDFTWDPNPEMIQKFIASGKELLKKNISQYKKQWISCILGDCLQKINQEESLSYYKMAVELGSKEAFPMIDEVSFGLSKASLDSLLLWLVNFANEKKAPDAADLLADLYLDQDKQTAFDWYKESARWGNVTSWKGVFKAYKKGDRWFDIKPNQKEAIRWNESIANLNNNSTSILAMEALIEDYYNSSPKNVTKTLEWVEKHYNTSQKEYEDFDCCYQKFEGLINADKDNVPQVLECWLRLANQDDLFAIEKLISVYEKGLSNIDPDPVEAEKWRQKYQDLKSSL